MTMSFDQVIKDMPKMFKMAEDLNRMTNYLNDMRIMFGFVIFSTFLGLFAFLLVRYCSKRKKRRKMMHNRRKIKDDETMMVDDIGSTPTDVEQQHQRWRNTTNSGRLSMNSGGRNLHKYPLTLPALDDKKENGGGKRGTPVEL